MEVFTDRACMKCCDKKSKFHIKHNRKTIIGYLRKMFVVVEGDTSDCFSADVLAISSAHDLAYLCNQRLSSEIQSDGFVTASKTM